MKPDPHALNRLLTKLLNESGSTPETASAVAAPFWFGVDAAMGIMQAAAAEMTVEEMLQQQQMMRSEYAGAQLALMESVGMVDDPAEPTELRPEIEDRLKRLN